MDATLRNLLDGCHRTPEEDTALLVAADRADECDLSRVAWILRVLARAGALNRVATGSRLYGTPTESSDYDWVLRTFDPTERQALWENCDRYRSAGSTVAIVYDGAVPYRLSASYRYGPINLIRVDTVPQFAVWRQGTEALVVARAVHGPRTRDEAIKTFQSLAERNGLRQ